MQQPGRLKHRFLFLGIAVALSVVPLLAGAGGPERPQSGGDYRAPLSVEPVTFDPAHYTDIYSMNVAANIFDGLLAFDQGLNIKAAIARRWKVSRDHRTYTFQLREGVRFHNGREVTAEDFIFSFERILAAETQSPAAPLLSKILGADAYRQGVSGSITGLSAPDPYTLKITLEKPFAPFLSILAMVNTPVVPAEAIGADFGRRPVGTGPFRFRSWTAGEEIVLEANDDYFAGRPFVDRLRFRIYGNDQWEKIYQDFQRGLLDHARLPKDSGELVRPDPQRDDAFDVVSRPGLNLVYVGINSAVPPLNDVRVRRALNYAVDTAAIVAAVTRRGATPATGILPPGLAGYDPDLPGYPYNPSRARELLAAAGYPDGKDFPALQLWTASKSASVQQELAEYRRYFADLGLRVEIKTAADWQTFVGAIAAGKAALYYAAWYADYPDADNFFYPLVHSQSRINRMGFDDPQVDEMLDRARVETDYIKRAELYRQVDRLVMHGAPTINQHYNSNNYLFGTWVRGGEMGPLGVTYFPFRQVWIDRQKRRQLSTLGVPLDGVAAAGRE